MQGKKSQVQDNNIEKLFEITFGDNAVQLEPQRKKDFRHQLIGNFVKPETSTFTNHMVVALGVIWALIIIRPFQIITIGQDYACHLYSLVITVNLVAVLITCFIIVRRYKYENAI